MGAGQGCARCILVFFNIIFMLIGLIFAGLGVAIVGFSETLRKFIPFDIEGMIEEVLDNVTDNEDNSQAAADLTEELFAVLQIVGIIFLVFGFFTLLITALGCCGPCCVVKCMLISYVVAVIVMIIAQIICIILYVTGTFDDPMKSSLQTRLKEGYEGSKGTNLDSIMINLAQYELECCGVENYRDFDDTENWDHTEPYENHAVNVAVPATCCKMTGSFPDDVELEDSTCPNIPTSANSHIDTGCFEAAKEELKSFQAYILGAVGGCIGLEVIFAVLAIVILMLKDRQSIEPV